MSGLTGPNAGNYSLSSSGDTPGSLTINPAALSITANSASKIYGTMTNFAGTEFTDSGLVNGDTESGVTR